MATTYGDHVALVSETFTGNLTNVLTPSSGKRLVITGWSLTCSGNTAACQATIVLGSNSHAATKFPIAGTVAGSPLLLWTVTGIRINGAANEVLKINGGAAGGVLDGIIFVSEI